MPPDNPPLNLYRFLSASALVVFAALVTVKLGVREFWTDEIVTLGHVRIFAATADAFHPRGYYVLLYGWKQLFGDSDLALRAFSVPWALLAFVLTWAIARRLLTSGQVALTLWLVALSPFVILYFRMARFYALVAAVSLLVAYCAVLVVQEGRRRHWTALALASPCLILTNYLAATLLGPLFLWLGALAFRGRQHWRVLAAAAPALLTVLLVGAQVYHFASRIAGIEAGAYQTSLTHLLLRIALPPFILAVGETTDPWRIWLTGPTLIAAAALFILGTAFRLRDPAWPLVRWAWLCSVVAGAVVLTTVARGEPLSAAARSTLFAAPLAYMLIAVGATRLQNRSLRAAAIAVLLVANLYGLRNYFAGTQFLNPGYAVPWRQIADAVSQREKPGDVVLSYFESTLERYGEFGHYIAGRPDYGPQFLEPVEAWPRDGFRLWLIARDRGSAQARRLQEATVHHLAPRARKVEVLRFMPYPPLERKFRSLFLRRQAPDAYVRVFLFTPPDNPREPEDAPPFLTGGPAPSHPAPPTHPEQDTP